MKYERVSRMQTSRGPSRNKAKLRADATPAEMTLMVALNAAREPYSFQYIVRTAESSCGYYVVDFYLPRRKLLVELDGAPHATEQGCWNDMLRSEAIERAKPNCLLVRVWNREVERDAAAVVRLLRTS